VIVVDPSRQGQRDLKRELRLLGLTPPRRGSAALIGAAHSRRDAPKC